MPGVDGGMTRALDRSELLRALRAFQRGDYTVRMPTGLSGLDGEIARTFNDLVRLNQSLAEECARAREDVELSESSRRRYEEVFYSSRGSDL